MNSIYGLDGRLSQEVPSQSVGETLISDVEAEQHEAEDEGDVEHG